MMSTQTVWQDLVAQALVGTERKGFTAPADAGAVTAALQALPPTPPERALLAWAGALALYHRVGQQPRPAPTDPVAATALPPEEWARCAPVVTQRLALLLRGDYPELMPEWLAALAQAQQRVSEEQLPALLDLGRSKQELRPAIQLVLGQRGRWLAAQNSAWDYVGYAPSANVWETGNRAARLAYLQALRKQDPAQGHELVKKVWKQEKAEERTAFLATWVIGLSMADEDFLETALNDRSTEVRRTAADLLVQLPAARLCRRMENRVKPLVSLITKRGHPPKLAVHLPTAHTPDMLHDGIREKPRSNKGEKTWWLRQIVSAVPLNYWTQTLNTAPTTWVELATASEWRAVLLESWALALERQAEVLTQTDAALVVDWATALLKALLEKPETISLHALLQLLPPMQREVMLLQTLRVEPATDNNSIVFRLLNEYPTPWNLTVSEAVLQVIEHCMQHNPNVYPGAALVLTRRSGYTMHPDIYAAANARLAGKAHDKPYWNEASEKLLAILHFRNAMLKEILG